MKFKLIITNETNKKQKTRILYAINHNEENFGLPNGVKLELKTKKITYEKILQHLIMSPCLVKFISSTNNRQLFFWHQNAVGVKHQIEPSKNIDGSQRVRYCGENFKLENDIIHEGSLFENYFINEWNPEKWNIADTHEIPIWTFCDFIDLYINRKQVFELEFIFYPEKQIFRII